ncbi:hypothetical protein ACIA8G_28995 [Lentzea sp. NPDC051213]|uniref:hypothetical protein n=1 Tax=Lentzea sp. NPDC051213 TaxID=3364126 RepID=UPI0037B798B9
MPEEQPSPAPVARPRRLGLGEPISPLLQRSAEPGGSTPPPGLGLPVVRQAAEPDPAQSAPASAPVEGSGEGDPGEPAPIAGFAEPVPILDLAEPVAGDDSSSGSVGESPADVVQRSADLGGNALPLVQRSAADQAKAAGPPAVQRVVGAAADTSAAAPAVKQSHPPTESSGPAAQRLVGDAPGLPVVARPDAASAEPTVAGFGEPVAQRLVGDGPSLPVVARLESGGASAAPQATTFQPVTITQPAASGQAATTGQAATIAERAISAQAAITAQRAIAGESAATGQAATVAERPITAQAAISAQRAITGQPAATGQAATTIQPAPALGMAGSEHGAATFESASSDNTTLGLTGIDSGLGATGGTTFALTKAGFGEPVAQRLVGSAPPMVQRTADFGPALPGVSQALPSSADRTSEPGPGNAPALGLGSVTGLGSQSVAQRTYAPQAPPAAPHRSPVPQLSAPPQHAPLLQRAALLRPSPPPQLSALPHHSPLLQPSPLLQRTAQPSATPDPPPLPVVVAARTPDPTPPPTPEPAAHPQPPQVIQRAEAPQPDPQPQAPAQSQSPEELLRKLYDPLLRRLKADLWLDRERRGALTDL